jgi:uncharacterized membrane protein
MRTRASLGGHPIHSMLVAIPIAAFAISLVFDVVYLISDNPFWYAMAFWLMIAGIAGGIAAGIPGLLDYLTSVPVEAMPTARRHGLLNGGLILWFAIDAVVRATGPMIGPRVGVAMLMSLIGVGVLGYTGWLGGALVYTHRVGVAEPAEAAAPPAVAPEPEERKAA